MASLSTSHCPTFVLSSSSIRNSHQLSSLTTAITTARRRPRPTIPIHVNSYACTPPPAASLSTQTKEARQERLRKGNRLQYKTSENAKVISDVQVGDSLIGTVCDLGHSNSVWLDVNIRTSKNRSVRGRLRFDQLKNPKSIQKGDILSVHVHSIQTASGRLELRLGMTPSPPKNMISETSRHISELNVGDCINECKVVAIGEYGAILDIDIYRYGKKGKKKKFHGLLSRRYFKDDWVTSNDMIKNDKVIKILNKDDTLINENIHVRHLNVTPPLILLDTRFVSTEEIENEKREKQKQRKWYQRRKNISTVKIGEVRRGTIREIFKFGVFIDLGLKRDGLLHFDQMGEELKSGEWKNVFNVGMSLHVEILSIDEGEGNVGVRLVEVPELELEEVRYRVGLPTATFDDVKLLKLLEEREKQVDGVFGVLIEDINYYDVVDVDVDVNVNVNDGEFEDSVTTADSIAIDVTATDEDVVITEDAVAKKRDETEEEEGEDEDDGDETIDDYLEDKYGY